MAEEQEMNQAVGESTPEEGNSPTDLPEAPVSITVRGYYKGFSVLITKRKDQMDEQELTKITAAIDNMEAKGFKPSWNEATNKGNGAQTAALGPKKPTEVKDAQATCPHTQFKVLQVKKEGPNQGKWFKTCRVCSKFLGWIDQ
jgi:hypothetical protein